MTWNRFCSIMTLISVPIFMVGKLTVYYNMVLLAAVIVFFCNVIFGLQKPQERIVFLCFQGMIFLFLLGRPVIAFFRGYVWWVADGTISANAGMFAVSILYISLLFMFFSAVTTRSLKQNIQERILIKNSSPFIKNLELVSFLIFCVSIICAYMEGMERIIFMQTHTYLDIYTGQFITKQPLLVKGFIQLMRPSMCVFLATFPKKRRTSIVLIAFLISTLPSLRVGTRNPTMLACLFIFIYYIMRDCLRQPDESKWFGSKEKIVVITALPFLICFMLVYTELRNGAISFVSVKMEHPLSNFIYEQGRTFNLLGEYFDVQDTLPRIGFPGYFLGYIHDTFMRNGLVQRILGITFPVGQSEELLAMGKALNNHLSYAVLGGMYFQGHGLDSSFVLDVFVDFNWTGVSVFSFVLSRLLLNALEYLSANWVLSTFTCMSFLSLMLIPRSSALLPVAFLISPYFWIALGICWFGAKLLTPKYLPRKGTQFIRDPLYWE